MKKLLFSVLAAVVMMGCGSDGETEEETKANDSGMLVITFVFGPSQTRSTLAELSLTDLWAFDYVGGSLVHTIHQSSTDGGFGSLSMAMDYGDHDIYFVASRGTSPTVSAPTITWEKPSDTFWGKTTMAVSPASASSQAVELKRVATRLRLVITDVIPNDAAYLKVTPSHWYYGLDITTGAGTSDQSTERSATIPAASIGYNDKLSVSYFGLSPSSEWTADVDVKMTTSDGTSLGNVSLSGVAFKQNRTTVYTGGVLGANRSTDISADGEWDADNSKTW